MVKGSGETGAAAFPDGAGYAPETDASMNCFRQSDAIPGDVLALSDSISPATVATDPGSARMSCLEAVGARPYVRYATMDTKAMHIKEITTVCLRG